MRDLRDFYDPHLHATINGTRFTVECPNAQDGFKLRAIMADPQLAQGANEITLINQLFKGDELPEDPTQLPTGGLWDEMVAAGVTWPEMLHLGLTAIHYFGLGEEIALRYWESADDKSGGAAAGKAVKPKTRRKKSNS